METAQRRVLDEENANAEEESSEEEEGEESETTKVLKMLAKASGRPKVEIPLYEGKLNVEDVMDWISALEKEF